MTPIELIDEFLSTYKWRGAFNATEVTDFLLDLRLAIQKQHIGGANGSIQEEPAAPDRANHDERELAHSGSVVETIG